MLLRLYRLPSDGCELGSGYSRNSSSSRETARHEPPMRPAARDRRFGPGRDFVALAAVDSDQALFHGLFQRAGDGSDRHANVRSQRAAKRPNVFVASDLADDASTGDRKAGFASALLGVSAFGRVWA